MDITKGEIKEQQWMSIKCNSKKCRKIDCIRQLFGQNNVLPDLLDIIKLYLTWEDQILIGRVCSRHHLAEAIVDRKATAEHFVREEKFNTEVISYCMYGDAELALELYNQVMEGKFSDEVTKKMEQLCAS